MKAGSKIFEMASCGMSANWIDGSSSFKSRATVSIAEKTPRALDSSTASGYSDKCHSVSIYIHMKNDISQTFFADIIFAKESEGLYRRTTSAVPVNPL